MENVTLLAAFAAGFLSFISPCVLPLIPGYVSFVSGVSLDEMRGGPDSAASAAIRRRTFITSLAFVLGFSLVFISLGASATVIGKMVMSNLSILGRIGGVVIILFGLHTIGVLRIGWLYQEKRVQTTKKPASLLGAMLVGVAFAFGWTPCIGPILAAILFVAGAQETVRQGIILLAIYSAGLAIPFIATSLAINHFFSAFAKIRRHYKAIEVTSGALLIVIGVLIFTGRLTIIAQYLTPYLPVY